MDLFGRDRTSGMYGADNHVLNEFLACLDGAQENAGVVVMASTNDIASMDEALVNRPGRFDIKFEIPLPDAQDRSDMLKCFLSEYHATPDQTVTNDTWHTVIKLTEGLTGAYIRLLAKTTVIHAVSDGKCAPGASACTFSTDNLNAAAEQCMANFAIGKKAKKHHQIESDTHVAQGPLLLKEPGIVPLKLAQGHR
jgi:SpoVK/Ycf46/Vps4 family AAA+-type ATPase